MTQRRVSGRSQFGGVNFIEVAILMPLAIFLIMGMMDLAIVAMNRFQMHSAASSIARRIQDTPRINLADLNSMIGNTLAGIKGQPASKSVGIQTYVAMPSGNWQNAVVGHSRNYIGANNNYFVGVVVRSTVETNSVMSPFLKNLLPANSYAVSSAVPIKNLQGCGPNRILVSDNNGSFACGPDCGPNRIPIVAPGGNAVVCGPPGVPGQFLRVGGGGTLQAVSIPACNQAGQVLRFDGANFQCVNLQLSHDEFQLRANHNTGGNCSNPMECGPGEFLVRYEDKNNWGDRLKAKDGVDLHDLVDSGNQNIPNNYCRFWCAKVKLN
jgi:hypothetical protein